VSVSEPTSAAAHATRTSITRLTLLFGLDSLGGGFLNTSLSPTGSSNASRCRKGRVALLFFAARTLNAASHVAAAWLAKRIGLVNTMVATHLPSSLFVMLVPVAPSAAVASALFLAREALVEMDVPTRQSYLMAIVRPEETDVGERRHQCHQKPGLGGGPFAGGRPHAAGGHVRAALRRQRAEDRLRPHPLPVVPENQAAEEERVG
jgi:hypothetical protein